MRINIDLPDDVAKTLNVLAAQSDTNRKNYIESVLVNLAGGGSKKENLKSNKLIKKAKN
jgi:hypothetical protein